MDYYSSNDKKKRDNPNNFQPNDDNYYYGEHEEGDEELETESNVKSRVKDYKHLNKNQSDSFNKPKYKAEDNANGNDFQKTAYFSKENFHKEQEMTTDADNIDRVDENFYNYLNELENNMKVFERKMQKIREGKDVGSKKGVSPFRTNQGQESSNGSKNLNVVGYFESLKDKHERNKEEVDSNSNLNRKNQYQTPNIKNDDSKFHARSNSSKVEKKSKQTDLEANYYTKKQQADDKRRAEDDEQDGDFVGFESFSKNNKGQGVSKKANQDSSEYESRIRELERKLEKERQEKSYYEKAFSEMKTSLARKEEEVSDLQDKLQSTQKFKSQFDAIQNKLSSESERISQQSGEIDKLVIDNTKMEISLKQSNEERSQLKRQNESLQTDLARFKEIASKRLEALNNLTEKIGEMEEKKELEKKNNQNIESQIKCYKFEYDQLVKNMNLLKKQHEVLVSKHEQLDADHYNLKQEYLKIGGKLGQGTGSGGSIQKELFKVQKENEMRSDIFGGYGGKMSSNPSVGNGTGNLGFNSTTGPIGGAKFHNASSDYSSFNMSQNIFTNNLGQDNAQVKKNNYFSEESHDNRNSNAINAYNTRTRISNQPDHNYAKQSNNVVYEDPNDKVFYPSEYNLKNNQNEILYINQKLSDLMTDKSRIENEILKLPKKLNTLEVRDRKKNLENNYNSVEQEINDMRARLRDIQNGRK